MQEGKLNQAQLEISQLEAGILSVLLYFDVFQYPLTAEEVARMHPDPQASACEVLGSMDRLHALGLLERNDGFFQVAGATPYATRRLKGNALAAQRMKRALKRSRFISKFPFVRAVMISGSLSKNYMEEGSDIDFFVVTQSGRLWVARTMLILYKKLFLFNSHKEFCMNYFVDTDHLEIEDKNTFTATEVKFLLPSYNPALYHAFHAANAWSDAYYPHFGLRDLATCAPSHEGSLKGLGEWLLSGRIGSALDAWCLKRTLARWRQKFAHFSAEKFELALRSRQYVSKHHPSHFQERVMTKLAQRKASIEAEWGISLSQSRVSSNQEAH